MEYVQCQNFPKPKPFETILEPKGKAVSWWNVSASVVKQQTHKLHSRSGWLVLKSPLDQSNPIDNGFLSTVCCQFKWLRLYQIRKKKRERKINPWYITCLFCANDLWNQTHICYKKGDLKKVSVANTPCRDWHQSDDVNNPRTQSTKTCFVPETQ